MQLLEDQSEVLITHCFVVHHQEEAVAGVCDIPADGGREGRRLSVDPSPPRNTGMPTTSLGQHRAMTKDRSSHWDVPQQAHPATLNSSEA